MKGWSTKPLGEVCELVNGAAFKPSDWDGSGLPIVRIQNLNDPTKPYNHTSKKLADKFRVKPGDTLLSWSGTPGTSFGCFRWSGPEGWLNQHIFNVHLGDEVLSSFFIYQVNSKLEELISKAHGGVGLQHITKGALSSVKITVPPLAEQQRIVNLLDEADELRKLRANADRRIAAIIPSLFYEMFGDLATDNRSWGCVELIEVISKEKHSIKRGPFGGAIKKEIFVPDGFKIYEQKNAIRDNFEIGTYFIDEAKFRELESFSILPDDLIVSCSGTIGRVAIVPSTAKPGIINQALLKLRLDKAKAVPLFFKYLLETDYMYSALFGGAGAAIKNVMPLSYIKKVRFPLPPLSLQKTFVERVTAIYCLEAEQTASRIRLDELFQSMLHRAFNGEL